MKVVWKTTGYTLVLLAMVVMVFSSGAFSLILYGRVTGQDWRFFEGSNHAPLAVQIGADHQSKPEPIPTAIVPIPTPVPIKERVMLEAPLILQLPELPVGCEVTSLAMLLQYAGISKGKLELAEELKKDPTLLRTDASGAIVFWGHPNEGFVGDLTGKRKGFGVYHKPMVKLLSSYLPKAVDLTGASFDEVERQLSAETPVVVWTTTYYDVPRKWVEWDSPSGTVRTTFSEHAVLIVGYDETSVYLNDPRKAEKAVKVDKKMFIESWTAMGKQAISYQK